MKIAIDARILRTTTGRYVERLLHYLQQIDHKNLYYVLLDPKDMDSWEPQHDNFVPIPAPFAQYSLAEQVGFAKLLRELNPDLVHFTMPQQPLLYFGKTVTTVHDLTLLRTYNSDKNKFVFKFKQFIGKGVFWLVGRKSSYIITPSNYTKQDYVKFAGIPGTKVVVTYEGADVAKTRPSPVRDLVGKPYLLYVGNQSDYKNIKRLMQAHQLLRRKYPDLLLVCAGKLSGPSGASLRMNKEWAREKGLKGIVYTDFVSDEELAWLYKNCACYVFPSLMEGFGLPGLEAMACGAPVASSNATCLPEIYGDAAEYFNPTSVHNMAETIYRILSNQKVRHRLIIAGSKQVTKYSWKRMTEQTLEIYEESA